MQNRYFFLVTFVQINKSNMLHVIDLWRFMMFMTNATVSINSWIKILLTLFDIYMKQNSFPDCVKECLI